MNRDFMKSGFGEWGEDVQSDQQKGLPQPPLEKPCTEGERIDLPPASERTLLNNQLFSAMIERKSTRVFSEESLSIEELSFLLYVTQGVKSVKGNQYATIRTVPSAGARHPFETYIVVRNVQGLKRGVYRYLALSHQLVYLFEDENSVSHMTEYTLNQPFAGKCAVTFVWSCVAYRGEWRYQKTSYKAMLLDAGHVCQNLYLACEAIKCGTCAIAAYDQKAIDAYFKLDGEDEFVVYVAPVGKLL